MLSTDIPPKFVQPFANNAGASYIAYPVANTAASPVASLDQGFPTSAFSAGGAPRGKDFNGVLKQTTAWARWIAAGGLAPYDATFQTAISGYPKGAVLLQAAGTNFWISTAESNMTNPDTGGAGWVAPVLANGSVATAMLADNAVTNAKLAQTPSGTVKGNNTGLPANALDLTANQLLVMLGLDTISVVAGGFNLPGFQIRYGNFTASNGATITFATPFSTSGYGGNINDTVNFNPGGYSAVSTSGFSLRYNGSGPLAGFYIFVGK